MNEAVVDVVCLLPYISVPQYDWNTILPPNEFCNELYASPNWNRAALLLVVKFVNPNIVGFAKVDPFTSIFKFPNNVLSEPVTLKLPVIRAEPVKGNAEAFRANEAVVANDELIAWLALCAQLDVILYVPTGKNEAVRALVAQEDVMLYVPTGRNEAVEANEALTALSTYEAVVA